MSMVSCAVALDVESYVSSTRDSGVFVRDLNALEAQNDKDEVLVLQLREDCRTKITFRRKNCKNVTKQMCERIIKLGVWQGKPQRPSSVHTYKFQYINADRIEYYDYRDGKSKHTIVLKEIKNCESRIFEEEKKCIDALFVIYNELMSMPCENDTRADSFTGQEKSFCGDNWECEEWIREQVNATAKKIQEKLCKKKRGTNGESSRVFY